MNGVLPVPPDSDWFPVRITDVGTGAFAGQYLFQEVWLGPNGQVADRIGGRVNTANDPAYAIDGSTFVGAVAGTPVKALSRRAPGSGGLKWELKGFVSTQLPPIMREAPWNVGGSLTITDPYYLVRGGDGNWLAFVDVAGPGLFTATGSIVGTGADIAIGLARLAWPSGASSPGNQMWYPVRSKVPSGQVVPLGYSALFPTLPFLANTGVGLIIMPWFSAPTDGQVSISQLAFMPTIGT